MGCCCSSGADQDGDPNNEALLDSGASNDYQPEPAAQPRPFSYESVRTLRPKKHHTHGTKRWTMHSRIKDTLSSGSTDIREVVKLPQDASENE
jgi:hypothetical protein